jgi:hypothetical protein
MRRQHGGRHLQPVHLFPLLIMANPRTWLGEHAAKILIVALLALPAVFGVVHRDESPIENRMPAVFPARPASWSAALEYPFKLDLWINDHFGFRRQLVRLNSRIRYRLFHQFPTHQVIEGRNGRIFLAAHATAHPPYSAIAVSCGMQFHGASLIAAQLNDFARGYEPLGFDPKMLIVPSAPVLYPEDLPAWLTAQCTPAAAPIPHVLAAPNLAPDTAARLYYPLERMRSLEPKVHAIPKTWFHWAGVGPRVVAQETVRRFWGLTQPVAALAVHMEMRDSDIAHLFEGVTLQSEIEVNDYAASGIEACEGPQCFPELSSIANQLIDMSRYRNARAPGRRLVLLTDSYGHYIAGDFAPFFREVVHISTNNFGLLDDTDMATLRQTFLHPEPGEQLLFVYHDISVLGGRIDADRKRLLPQNLL